MIQDIGEHVFDNSYGIYEPENGDRIVCFDGDLVLTGYDEERKRLLIPTFEQMDQTVDPIYVFSIDGTKHFISSGICETEGYAYHGLRELMQYDTADNAEIFAVFSAYHLHRWYSSSRYCGSCGSERIRSGREGAMVCPKCGDVIYPRINPAVIVAVTDGDRIILTRYRSGFAHNALVAGFCEFGETFEDTVRREVMEEVGLKVRNIRYYKSQPWASALDLLAGFVCEVDGDNAIRMDENELRYAQWTKREDIELQPYDYSLTNEMMRMFRDGKL